MKFIPIAGFNLLTVDPEDQNNAQIEAQNFIKILDPYLTLFTANIHSEYNLENNCHQIAKIISNVVNEINESNRLTHFYIFIDRLYFLYIDENKSYCYDELPKEIITLFQTYRNFENENIGNVIICGSYDLIPKGKPIAIVKYNSLTD